MFVKILIVDDEVLIRKVIKEYCILENYEVVEAENGIDAIEKIKHDNIDLIVLDVMMPKLDGLSAFKEIKKIKIYQLLFYQHVVKNLIN